MQWSEANSKQGGGRGGTSTFGDGWRWGKKSAGRRKNQSKFIVEQEEMRKRSRVTFFGPCGLMTLSPLSLFFFPWSSPSSRLLPSFLPSSSPCAILPPSFLPSFFLLSASPENPKCKNWSDFHSFGSPSPPLCSLASINVSAPQGAKTRPFLWMIIEIWIGRGRRIRRSESLVWHN